MENETMSNNEQKEKLTWIDCMVTAMFSPKEYGKLIRLSGGKIAKYVAVLLLLVCTIQYAIPTLGSIAGLGGMKDIILYEIPQFSLKDGVFYLEEKIEIIDEATGASVIVDTTVDVFTKEDVPANMIQAVLVSKSNMLVYNSVYGMETTDESKFEDMKDVEISNETVSELSGAIYFLLVCVFVFFYFAAVMEYLIIALVYGGFLYMMVKLIMPELRFGKVYKAGLFAQTIGVLVEAVTYCLGIELLYMAGAIFNVFITVVLMNKAVLQFKINKQV